MAKSSRRLGRGLDSLVSDLSRRDVQKEPTSRKRDGTVGGGEQPATDSDSGSAAEVRSIPVENLSPNPCQPRSMIVPETLLSLTESIKRYGVLQPIPVRRAGKRFEIVAGERRWRAAKAAGLAEVPVIVREATDEEMLELALIENIQREDLNAIDRAKGYKELCDRFGLGADEVGRRVGEDRTTVTNYLRLLELPRAIQDLVSTDKLSMGHARCLLGVDGADRRDQLAKSAVENELSVRALEEIVRRERTRQGGPVAGARPEDRAASVHVTGLQRRFEEALKTKVTIHEGRKKGRGRIVIDYFSLDDFDRIAERLGVGLEG